MVVLPFQSYTRYQRHLSHPRRLHPALQLPTHQHRGDPLVQAANPSAQLLLQQGPVWTPEQTLQRKDLLVQLAHPSWQCLPAAQEGQSSRQGQVQMLHEHTEGKPGDLHQPGGQRSVKCIRITFSISDMLCISLTFLLLLQAFLLWSVIG